MSIEKEAWFQHIAARPIPLPFEKAKNIALELWRDYMGQIQQWEEQGLDVPPENWEIGPVTYVFQNVRGASRPVDFYLRPVYKGSSSGFGGAYYKRSTNPSDMDEIVVEVLAGESSNPTSVEDLVWGVDQSAARDRLARLIHHEVTHVIDIFTQAPGVSPGADFTEYVNQPHEVRAFMQNIAQEVESYFEGWDHSRYPKQQLLREALFRSEHWDTVEPHLTPANRKKILQGVVRHLQDRGIF